MRDSSWAQNLDLASNYLSATYGLRALESQGPGQSLRMQACFLLRLAIIIMTGFDLFVGVVMRCDFVVLKMLSMVAFSWKR